MRGTISRRCHCRHPETGKELGAACPALKQSKHGEWEYRDRITTTTGRRSYRRGGHTRKADAEEYAKRVQELIGLARGDAHDEARVGDLLFGIKRGADLPSADTIRRRLGLRGDLDRSQTVGSWLDEWFASKRALRPSTARSYRQHLDLYLIPQLGQFPLDRLTAEHIADMFDLIEEWNQEIRAARAEGRRPVLQNDQRTRPQVVSNTTQRRVFATLRNALNTAWKRRRIDVNPALFVEMPAERHEPAQVWDPDQVATFLDHVEGERLGLLFRLVLLHGPRRGEAVGARWAGFNEETGELKVARPLLQFGGKIVEGDPKTRAGERTLYLDRATVEMLKRLRTAQKRERMLLGEAYDDDDLIFCREDGTPFPPDYVSRKFREWSTAAGLPRIRLHDGRHTAASLALEAKVDIKVVSKRMGHSKTGFTQDTYQHVRRAVHDDAAEAVVRLLPERHRGAG